MKKSIKKPIIQKLTFALASFWGSAPLLFVRKTVALFFKNNLDIFTLACAFNFLFSFFPLVFATLSVALAILRGRPEVFASLCATLSATLLQHNFAIDIYSIIASVTSASLTLTNITLAIFIVWMARKLFLTIFKALAIIFNKTSKRVTVLSHILTLAAVVGMVVLTTVVFLLAYTTRQVLRLPFFSEVRALYPFFFKGLTNFATQALLYVILYLFTFFVYKAYTVHKAATRLAAFCALLCVAFSASCTQLVALFINKTNYNLIYGVMSNVLIMLFEVYIYFVFFMLLAQALALLCKSGE